MVNYKAKFMCSYGGEIQPRTHDNKLCYVGGDNKILYVLRNIKFEALLAELSALFDEAPAVVSFKFQIPDGDLDALISVNNDNDLEDMMLVYDQLYRASAARARMRLFLFPNNPFDPDFDSAELDLVKSSSNVAVSTFYGVVVSDPKVNHPGEVQRQLQLPSASCSSSLIGPLTAANYDVFISFRGVDTRRNFTSHLYKALSQKRIKTFIDYELHKADEISSSLVRAIENSYVSVVVFSENYASSKWCLEELVKILECRKERVQAVIPVFYNIDPSHVRKQLGSYKKAFKKHSQKFMLDMNKLQKWKKALTEAANISGWDSHSYSDRNESELVEDIVNDISQKLTHHHPPNDCHKGLVGIDKNSASVESILREAPLVGIWGMGGIGKTTLARYIFGEYSSQYEGCCFLENVREISVKKGLHYLLDRLYSELLQKKIRQNSTAKSTFLECILRKQRNLIVLDDVGSSEQLEYLIGELQCYGPGSRIIITTRDKWLLKNWGVENMYELKGLDFQESLTLFSLNAFKEDYPQMEYKELSRKAVVYCKGNPLALKVLGSFLYCKSKIVWDRELQKLEKIPNEKIQSVLRISFDGLDHMEKQIFLDIACFLKGKLKEHVVNILDACGYCAVITIRSLLNKALIHMLGDSVWMHDLIQEMGCEIVRQEYINPGNRSRLFDIDDVCDVLKNTKGTEAIEGIILDMSRSRKNLFSSTDTIKKMPNLRYIKYKHGKFCNLQLPIALETLSNELRYLEWDGYPLQSMPPYFCPEKLVSLHMQSSQLTKLWDGVQNLVNLKEVDLTESLELEELPDFSKATNLEHVRLSYCKSLRHLHPSILSLGKLKQLNLLNCVKLQMLESEIPSRSLEQLNVDGCSSLMKFALSSEEIENLDLSQTGVKVLHSSIGHFSKVKAISLRGLRLENLPSELSYLKSLEKLSLYGCGRVVSKQRLHDIFVGLESLQILSLENCHNLSELPDNVRRLSSLQKLLLDGSQVETLPDSIKHLSKLKTLSLMGCSRLRSLPELPSSVRHLKAMNCTLLKAVTFWLITPGLQGKKRINISFQNCVNLDAEKCIFPFLEYVRELACRCELRRRRGRGKEEGIALRSDFFKICYPHYTVPEWFMYRAKGASISFEVAPPSIYHFSSLICIVLSSSSFDHELDIKCRCYLEDGNMHKYSFGVSIVNRIRAGGNSDHVCLAYNYGGIFDLIKLDRLNNRIASSGHNPKVTFEFFVSCNVTGWNQDDNLLIKECGVYPLYAPDYCIKQMELEARGTGMLSSPEHIEP